MDDTKDMATVTTLAVGWVHSTDGPWGHKMATWKGEVTAQGWAEETVRQSGQRWAWARALVTVVWLACLGARVWD